MPTLYWLVDRADLDRLGAFQGLTKHQLKDKLEELLKHEPTLFDRIVVIRGSELALKSYTTVALGSYPRTPRKLKHSKEKTHG